MGSFDRWTSSPLGSVADYAEDARCAGMMGVASFWSLEGSTYCRREAEQLAGQDERVDRSLGITSA